MLRAAWRALSSIGSRTATQTPVLGLPGRGRAGLPSDQWGLQPQSLLQAARGYAIQKPVQPSHDSDPPSSMLLKDYRNIPGIEKVDDVVKRLLSLEMASRKETLKIKQEWLMNKVMANPEDTKSLETRTKVVRKGCVVKAEVPTALLTGLAELSVCTGKGLLEWPPPRVANFCFCPHLSNTNGNHIRGPVSQGLRRQVELMILKIVALTVKIHNYEEHMQKHRKDKTHKRYLLMSIDQRRKMLKNLRKTNFDAFERICRELQIEYTFPPLYYRAAHRRFLAKRALCLQVFQEVQKIKKQKRALKAAAAAQRQGDQGKPKTPPQAYAEALRENY